ncbi:hypothetical protein Tco_0448732 [Tanacetum coccineum]
MNIDDKDKTDSQFESIADDVYTTFFEKAEPEKLEPGKTRNVKAQQDVLECSKKDDVQECSNIMEKEDQQDVHPDTEAIVIGSSSSELECSSTSELEYEESDDGKDDDELWSPKSIGTTSKNLISPKIKGASSNSTPSTKKQLVKSSEPIRNCIIGLANNKTWEIIVNKKIGVKKEEVKEQVKESKEHVKKGKRKMSDWALCWCFIRLLVMVM